MSGGSARLNHAIRTLQEHWQTTRDQWADRNAQDFETNHLIPLEQQVENARRGMDKMDEILQRVRRDCS